MVTLGHHKSLQATSGHLGLPQVTTSRQVTPRGHRRVTVDGGRSRLDAGLHNDD